MTRAAWVAYLLRHTAPGPRPGPLGNLLDVAQGRFYELLHHMWRGYGDISCARVGAKLVYLVVHPDQVQHVLVKREPSRSATPRSFASKATISTGLEETM